MNYELQTKIGKLFIQPTDRKHVFATCDKNYLVIRNCHYNVSIHVYRYSDWTWNVGKESDPECFRITYGTYIFRSYSESKAEVSRSARHAIVNVVLPEIRKWIEAHPAEMQKAELDDLHSHYEKLLETITEKNKELENLNAELENLKRQIAECSQQQ